MPGIHPAILFIVIKNIILFLAFYFGGASLNFLLWWSVGSAAFYALAAPTLPSASNRGSKMRNSPKEPGLAFWIKIATPGLADHPEWLPA